jgi:hypothetical protein
MTKVSLLESHSHEMDGRAAPPATDTDALLKEARRRRRRRRAAACVGIVLIAAIVVGSVLAAGGGSNVPRKATDRNQGSPHAVIQSRQHTHAASPLPVYPPAQTVGVADNSLAWVTRGDSFEITSNKGEIWQTITPPTLHGVTVSIHITAVAAIGTDNLWVAIYDVPGLVSQPNNGSSRGEGIEHSTDGGRSWSLVFPPGCLQTCGPLSLSMVDEFGARPTLPRLFDTGRRSNLDPDRDHAQPRWRRRRWASPRITAALHQQSRWMGRSRDVPRV